MFKRIIISFAAFLLILFISAIYMSSGSFPKEHYYQILHYAEPNRQPDSSFSVTTYNIGYLSGMTNNQSVKREEKLFAKNLIRGKELFSIINPDLVGFQEIDFGADRSFAINQLDSVALAAGYCAAYRSVNWDKNYVPFPYWPPSNHFGSVLSGQAILSRLPITGGNTIVLPADKSTPFYYQAFYIDRLLQITSMTWLGQELVVMNVHLEAFNRETRVKQAQIVKEAFEKYASQQPVILMGDFNSLVPELEEKSDAIELLLESEFISSAIPLDRHDQHTTYSSIKPIRMIDYIFYNSNFLRCDSARVFREAGDISDHLPVWAQLQLVAY